MSIRVVICDDHEVVRCGMQALLAGTNIEIVGSADNAADTLQLLKTSHPHILLLDVRMGDEDGLNLLDLVRGQYPTISAVVLSTYDNPTYVARAIALGAKDYLLKDSSRSEIIDAIRRTAANEPALETSLMRRVQATMQRRKERVSSKDIPLTNRELQVLRHIALGLSNKEIGTSLSISVETVKEHVQNILRKLDSADRTAAAVWAVKSGLISD